MEKPNVHQLINKQNVDIRKMENYSTMKSVVKIPKVPTLYHMRKISIDKGLKRQEN